MDAVAEFYSKPQVGGAFRVGSSRNERYFKYSIPLHRTARERVGDGVEEAVKVAGGKAIQKYAHDNAKTGEKRKIREEGTKNRQRFVNGGASGIIARALDEDDDGKPIAAKPKPKKHKRSRIDDVLGDDTY